MTLLTLSNISTLLAGAATFGLMAWTAVHILINKHDTRAAVGWLGLVWFAPLLGVILYWIFGINRIQRKAHQLFADQIPLQLPPTESAILPHHLVTELGSHWQDMAILAKLTDHVSTLPLMGGNRFTLLINGDQAYPAMLAAIDQAEQSISLTTYIFDNDAWGKQFRNALARAARRDVAVRVLIDDVGARYSFPSIVGQLSRSGVEAARFMRSWKPWRFRYYNLRSHRKIMVVDGRTGFTGGMNIRASHVLGDKPAHPVQDLHFKVTGPVVAELQRAFASDWVFTTREELSGPDWFPELQPQGQAVARGIADGPDEDFDRLRKVLLGALSCARQSVRIATPYFLPDQELMTALKIAVLRGVRVEILQSGKSNLKMVGWASQPGLEELSRAGCTIIQTPPPFDHTKVMVVDDAWVLLGSGNWDPRSLYLNFEFNVEVYDRELATSVNGLLNQKKARGSVMSLGPGESFQQLRHLRNTVFRLFSPYL